MKYPPRVGPWELWGGLAVQEVEVMGMDGSACFIDVGNGHSVFASALGRKLGGGGLALWCRPGCAQ